MVCADGVADFGFLLEFLGQLCAVECVGQFAFFVGHLTNVVEQASALCLLGVQAEFGCHNGAEVGCFASVLQEVLSVGGAIFHFAYDAHEFGVQSVDAEVNGGALTCFDNFLFHLFAHFGHDFLNACGVDASVGNELVECQAADFAAHGVEGGDDDGFGRIVYNDFHASGGFEGADVAAFASDDAALHFVVVNMEDGDAVFDGRFGSHALDALDNDALGFLIGGHFGIVHDFVDI